MPSLYTDYPEGQAINDFTSTFVANYGELIRHPVSTVLVGHDGTSTTTYKLGGSMMRLASGPSLVAPYSWQILQNTPNGSRTDTFTNAYGGSRYTTAWYSAQLGFMGLKEGDPSHILSLLNVLLGLTAFTDATTALIATQNTAQAAIADFHLQAADGIVTVPINRVRQVDDYDVTGNLVYTTKRYTVDIFCDSASKDAVEHLKELTERYNHMGFTATTFLQPQGGIIRAVTAV